MNALWSRKPIGQLIDGLAAGVSVRSTAGIGVGPKVLKTSAVDQGRFRPEESKPILAADLERARCSVVADSLILSRMNTPTMVGDVGYVDRDYPELFLPDRLWLARSRRNVGTDIRWLTYYFASDPGARQLRGLATGTSGSMKNIPKTRILGLEIDAPSPSEQRAISSALSIADGVIHALEVLIVKRQAIKQGMMQQILTGRTRLPGFIDDWRPVRLRDAGTTYGGLTGKDKSDFGTGSASFVTFTEVIAGARLLGCGLDQVRVRPGERQNQVQRGDVLFNGSSETPDEVALSAVVEFDPSPTTYLNSFCFGYRIKDAQLIDPTYLAFFFRSGGGRDLVASLAQGAIRYNIAKTKLLEVRPLLPRIDEQRAIVAVIRDAEAVIDALNVRLAKTRAIKIGMMQELLTGRTRLTAEAAS